VAASCSPLIMPGRRSRLRYQCKAPLGGRIQFVRKHVDLAELGCRQSDLAVLLKRPDALSEDGSDACHVISPLRWMAARSPAPPASPASARAPSPALGWSHSLPGALLGILLRIMLVQGLLQGFAHIALLRPEQEVQISHGPLNGMRVALPGSRLGLLLARLAARSGVSPTRRDPTTRATAGLISAIAPRTK
jgi:hypothetical protein